VLLGVSYGLAVWGGHQGWRLTVPYYRLLWSVAAINLGLLIFNLLPIYPMDGGQILRSLLWFVLGSARSLKVVSVVGLLGAAGLIAAAVFLHSFWIGLISLYLLWNCWMGLQHAQILSWSTPVPSQGALRGRLGEEYREITDPDVQARVRARHSAKTVSLQALGFQHFAYCLELLPPYSAISRFPLVLVMRKREVLVFPRPARLGIAYAILGHSNPASIAGITGLGTKFYSVFSDGTLLISSSYRSPLVAGANSRIIQSPCCETVEEAWRAHKLKVSELQAQGSTLRSLSSFADYVEIERLKLGMVVEA
jgi:hypothetical protein